MIIFSIMQCLFDGICWFIGVMKFVESDEGLLSCWGRSVFNCAGIEKVACLCKFDESDEGNLVQK